MKLLELNEKLFWILNSPAGKPADAVMIGFTVSGYVVPAVIIALAAMRLYGGLNGKNVVMLAAALLLGGAAVHSIKQSLPADRPLAYFAVKKADPMDSKVHAPFRRLYHRTFPSGHAQTAFGVALLMVFLFKRHIVLWMAWALFAAFSRVYLGLHFPLDILGGSLIGALAALLVFEAGKRYGIKKGERENRQPRPL